MTRAGRALALAVLLVCSLQAAPALSARHLNAIRIAGSINPAVSDFIQRAITQSAADGAVALILELDTPGGLVSATKDIIQAMLNASVPIVVYVSPQGAWAGSAGTFITIAGHVAAMAPGTSIGAAHPVGIGVPGGGGVVEVQLVPDGTAAANPAFDVTPARLVSGLITERGVFAATREVLSSLGG